MDNGHRLGLMLLYGGMVLYALLLLRILVQIFFGSAIESYREHQWRQSHTGAADRFRTLDGKRGWANSWLPRSSDVKLPAPKVHTAARPATLPLLVTQAMAVVFLLIALGLASTVAAQPAGPARNASSSELKKELIGVRTREVQLRIRLEEIDQELKPEAIERELAGIGSVHPEELRENRRKLLTIERNGLEAELDLLEEYRARIEAAIAIDEEAATLLQYERPAAKPSPQPQMSLALRNVRRPQLVLKLFGALSILIMLAGGLIFLLIVGLQLYAQRGDGRAPAAAKHTQMRAQAAIQTITTAALPLKRAQL